MLVEICKWGKQMRRINRAQQIRAWHILNFALLAEMLTSLSKCPSCSPRLESPRNFNSDILRETYIQAELKVSKPAMFAGNYLNPKFSP
jgi:hypothetical protein